MNRWLKKDSTLLVDDRWLRLTADTCEIAPGKFVAPYYVAHEREWVQIYAVNAAHDVLTVRQYRYAADVFCTELPGGVVDPGESLETAARRELREETGHVAARWHYVGKLWANPARQTNAVHLFVAQDLQHAGDQSLDDSEEITWRFLSPDALAAAIDEGEFSQCLHVASVYRAQRHLASREKGGRAS